MGGLGNQMFQYAFARNLSLKYNKPLKIDLSFLKNKNQGPNFTYRDYNLNIFDIDVDFEIPKNEVGYLLKENALQTATTNINYVNTFIQKNINHNFVLSGYWQSQNCFIDIKDQIKQDFTFKNSVTKSKEYIQKMYNDIISCNSVMIHVRRTDYLKHPDYYYVVDNDYIQNSTNIINTKINSPHFFVFSDDIEWCKDNIKYKNTTFVDNTYTDHTSNYHVQLMCSCKHFIISNSTFSWWSAWLGKSTDSLIIAPKKWYKTSSVNADEIVPSDWLRV